MAIMKLLSVHLAMTMTTVMSKTIGSLDMRQSVLAELDGNVTLRCVSPSPWFFCVWEGPQGGRVCGLRDKLDAEKKALTEELTKKRQELHELASNNDKQSREVK